MKRTYGTIGLAVLLATAAASPARTPALTDDDFIVVSGPASPRVAYAIARGQSELRVVVDVQSTRPDGSDVRVAAGLAAAGKVVLAADKPLAGTGAGTARFAWAVPASKLIRSDADWARLRMALAVRWTGGALGADRRRERFRHLDSAAPHAGLSHDPNHWAPLDLVEHAAVVADRKDRIVVRFDQPMAGKATIVIEDAAGRRVRNLLSGQPMAKGPGRAAWDGADDDGQLVAPGTYRWRAAHHPGITPRYLMSYCNGSERFLRSFGTNHGLFETAAANAKYAFFGAALTEGGYALIAVDPPGRFRHGYTQIHGTGIHSVQIAADAKHFYAAHDGPSWGQRVDRDKPGWKAPVRVTLTRFDIETERTVDFPGRRRFATVESYDWGPGSATPACRKQLSLAGMTHLAGRLYLSSRSEAAVLALDPATAKIVGRIALPQPGPLASARGTLYAVTGSAVVRIDPANSKRQEIVPAGRIKPTGLAVDDDGTVYVSDGRTSQVRAFGPAGRALRTIGTPGGAYQGPYDPRRMVNPAGLAVTSAGLWVTERRTNPKRVALWNLAGQNVLAEKFGCPPYGGPAASFDPAKPTCWLGMGARWRLDFAKGSARCLSILQAAGGHLAGRYPWCIHYRFVRSAGRTFLIGLSKATFVSELMADGSLKDLACVGSCHHFCYGCDWRPPQAFIDAFNAAYPGRKGKHSDKGPGVMWVDANGDGLPQAGEFNFSTDAPNFAGSGWGHAQHDLTLHIPVRLKDGANALAVLRPDGFDPGGAPNYPTLNAAIASAVRLKDEVASYDYKRIHVETAVDRFGNVVFNTDPQMVCHGPDGRLNWRYPNRWTNVHGSHDAPLPETGVLQGTLFFLGMAKLDDKADVFMMNGNHGRFFVMTSDGLYLDEMFKDVRMGGARDETYIGGEAFGGSFGRAHADGRYYLQTGGDGYRVYRVEGLSKLRRSSGTITVTPSQLLAAERTLTRAAPPTAAERSATIGRRDKPPTIDGRDRDWPRPATIAWDRSGQFPVRLRCAYDDENLYLLYDVRDASPWVNRGKDWTTLFKTGDSVDLQLATDANAPPKRRGPAPGDLRLLIAPFAAKPLAVLYRHRQPGAPNPVTFTCPWRSETVDVVRKVPAARIAVEVASDRYRVEAAIPLAELGLAAPAGRRLRADFGVIYGDRDGSINMLRSYWANPATMLVNDVPGEIMLHPNRWGTVRFEGDNR